MRTTSKVRGQKPAVFSGEAKKTGSRFAPRAFPAQTQQAANPVEKNQDQDLLAAYFDRRRLAHASRGAASATGHSPDEVRAGQKRNSARGGPEPEQTEPERAPVTVKAPITNNRAQPIQGFWKELIFGALLGVGGLYLGGPLLGAVGVVVGAGIGNALSGSAVQFHVRRMGEHLDSTKKTDYTEDYKDIKIMVGNDPGFVFHDDKEEIEISYNFLQLAEIYGSPMRLTLHSMVPGNLRKLDQEEAISKAFKKASVSKAENTSKDELFERSEKRANTFDYGEYDKAFNPSEVSKIKKTLETSTSEQAAKILLASNSGLVLGEKHTEPDSKQFLVEKMKELEKSGVDTIYLEHLRDDYQEMLDIWNNKRQEMPEQLEKAVEGNDRGNNLSKDDFNILKVMKAANALGIRVVGIDSLAAQYVESPGAGEEKRALTMNVFAEEVILKDRRNRVGKYVILTGQQHSNTHRGGEAFKQVKTLPGFSQMLNIPAVTYNPKGDKLVLDVDQYRRGQQERKEKLN